MRKITVLSFIIFFVAFASAFIQKTESPFLSLSKSPQRNGNAADGYRYLLYGDYVQSGPPDLLYDFIFGKKDLGYLDREGKNGKVAFYFNVISAENRKEIVVPNCLQCHADVFNKELIIGLPRANGNFTYRQSYGNPFFQKAAYRFLEEVFPQYYAAGKEFITSAEWVGSEFLTNTYGTNPGARLTVCLMRHHDPNTLQWTNEPQFDLSSSVIPSDVPAWWLLKKKAAMYYSGEARGDFGKFMMVSSLLTMNDTTHAADVDRHMPDVLSFIQSLKAPSYPGRIDKTLAEKGKKIFVSNCNSCHGNYGEKETYPNLLIPGSVVGTDSLMYLSNFNGAGAVNWFNNSWFSKGDHAGKLVPFKGYLAPPLDGIWITAPYFHNGSVPTLEGVLNSKLRPAFWSRDFDHPEYAIDNPGWKYKTETKGGRNSIYNTTLPGYGNYGHYFGDALTAEERKAVIEYLKTL